MRSKIYYKWNIPGTVVEIVKSVCADYDRRQKSIACEELSEEVKARYIELNSAIDRALASIDEGMRRPMLEDVQSGRGYNFSFASCYCAKTTYYNCKRKIIHDVAVELKLISAEISQNIHKL